MIKHLLIVVLITCNQFTQLYSFNVLKCDRIPDGTGTPKSPPDGRFKLFVNNDPGHIVPGETYTSKSLFYF